MADPKEEEEELVPVVEGDEEDKPGEGDKPGGEEAKPGEEDDEDEDERLADHEDDEGDPAEASASSKRRQQRRERTRQRKAETTRELEMLRQQNLEFRQRLTAVEGHSLHTTAQQIDARLNQTREDIRQAEAIYAKAVADGAGDHALHAMRIRDAATKEADRLEAASEQLKEAAKVPRVDPRVTRHAADWMRDNPWYDPQGGDEVSALTKRIDTVLAAEGYDPASRVYWEELTARVTKALKPAGETPAPSPTPTPAARRSAPPMGSSSEHAPISTRKTEIRVTPERKAAMVEAGVWDDPVRRQRVLREYQDFDKQAAR